MREVNSSVLDFLIVGGISFLITFLLIPITISIGKKLDLTEKLPLLHSNYNFKPTLGGIPIFIGWILAIFITPHVLDLSLMAHIGLSTFIVLVIGVCKDLDQLNGYLKFTGQFSAAFVIIYVCDIRLMSLYGLFGIYEIPLVVSYLLSAFTIIVITNAYNLIDGIDGLAGSVGIICTLFFGTWFYLVGLEFYSFIAFSILGGLLAFLQFNWAPSKVFMGDTGSLMIGFFLSIVAIKFIDGNYNLPLDHPYRFDAFIGPTIAVLIVPLYDTLRVFIKRMLRGKSPMHPDRTHLHHILLRLGCNHAQATGILVTVNVIFVLLALVLKGFSDAIVLPALIITALALGTITELIFKSMIEKRREELKERNRAFRKEAKVVSITKSAG
ncbi:MAG: undecaprenyl-phosphate alpha-N-acetylglucosaminyl 1-phosphate transferase [Cytophagales bacterium CG12_big_fil_rev_8_21_14_0_65_40_12]|nr:MAG: undecaprenyl-phosphate alpha-N-acetylglucosaminyl 1-phosphate transferase [Cytophagales bacterium CG12_big_fil_rev_8_21_14_0_65_40_12]